MRMFTSLQFGVSLQSTDRSSNIGVVANSFLATNRHGAWLLVHNSNIKYLFESVSWISFSTGATYFFDETSSVLCIKNSVLDRKPESPTISSAPCLCAKAVACTKRMFRVISEFINRSQNSAENTRFVCRSCRTLLKLPNNS